MTPTVVLPVIIGGLYAAGVYLIVLGLVLDVLRSLGAELDRQVDEDDPIDSAPDEVIVR